MLEDAFGEHGGQRMIRFGYADTSRGQVHYAACGSEEATPVLLFHQTPRSWDEFREVLPLVGRAGFRAIAPDTIGFGHSARLGPGEHSIEMYADVAVEFAAVLGISSAVAVGHYTGALVALEVAARAPSLVSRLVLSSCPSYDAEARKSAAGHPVIDAVTVEADGSHLTQLWRNRAPYYPPGRPDLLARFVRDALAAGEGAVEGHLAGQEYPIEIRSLFVKCPVLCIGASADPFTFDDLRPVADRFVDERTAVIDGGTIPLMEQRPEEVAELIRGFVS